MRQRQRHKKTAHLYKSRMDWPTINGWPPHTRLQGARLVEVAIDSIEAGTRGGTRILGILRESDSSLNTITNRRTSKEQQQYQGKKVEEKRNRTSVRHTSLQPSLTHNKKNSRLSPTCAFCLWNPPSVGGHSETRCKTCGVLKFWKQYYNTDGGRSNITYAEYLSFVRMHAINTTQNHQCFKQSAQPLCLQGLHLSLGWSCLECPPFPGPASRSTFEWETRPRSFCTDPVSVESFALQSGGRACWEVGKERVMMRAK